MDATPRCGRCYRVLRSAESIRRGYGKGCAALIRKAGTARVSEYKPEQYVKAAEAIDDRAVIPSRNRRVFLVVSEDGNHVYRTAHNTCSCPAGIRGVRCWHRLAVAMYAGIPAPAPRIAIAMPVRRTVPTVRKAPVVEFPPVITSEIEEARIAYRAAYLESKCAREEYRQAILAENRNPAMLRDYSTLSTYSDYEIASHAVVCQTRAALCRVVGPANV